ncbi:bifunctional precorrin-2 dehydrogenase/sirohydrochlorin ferrochelatase [Verrucomicrobiota bacterium]
MKYFPINMDIAEKKVLIVGGGQVASRKAKSLLACGAIVTIVSPEFCTPLTRMKKVNRICRKYRKSDLKNASIVICATDSKNVNCKVSEHAKEKGIPINVVDQPDLCTFTVPSTVSRGELLITISTGGGSPALSRRIREKMEKEITDIHAKHLSLLKKIRPKVQSSGLSEKERMRLLKKMASDKIQNRLKNKGLLSAKTAMQEMLTEATRNIKML